MAMPDKLPCLRATTGQSKPAYDVIKSPLQKRQKRIAGVARRPACNIEQSAKLSFEHSVVPLQFLLLAQPNAVRARLALLPLMHTRRILAALERTLRRIASGALQEELQAFTAAELANWIRVTCHLLVLESP